MSTEIESNDNPQVILANYKQMMSECQALAMKIQELKIEGDEHRLVVDQLTKLESSRKACRYSIHCI